MTTATQRNARFWTWENQGWVKLTLKPGQSLAHYEGHATDEGYHSEATRWHHEGDQVRREFASYDRDCDGPMERFQDHVCPLGELKAVDQCEIEDCAENHGIFRPQWTRESASQRDHYAEAMGY